MSLVPSRQALDSTRRLCQSCQSSVGNSVCLVIQVNQFVIIDWLRRFSEFTTKIQSYGPVHPAHPSRTSIAISQLQERERSNEDKVEGSLSDTAISSESQMEQLNVICNTPANTSGSGRNQSGLTKKSNSTSQLSVSGESTTDVVIILSIVNLMFLSES